jgi:signal transduction histidine kinase
VTIETLWAGYVDTDARQLMPRQSFEAWRELKRGQAQHWTEAEVRLAIAISERMAGAAKQHRLYQDVRSLNASLEKQVSDRTAELSQTLEHLKQAQAQLVQSEKMSSLGQLVAGIAHEINNPVNFITGNLTHVRQYTEALVEAFKLYQQQYPAPPQAIQAVLQAVDLEFVEQDLPKLFSSLEVGTTRIRDIVLSLRNFSRLDQAEVKSVDIQEGIDGALLILQHRFQASGILLTRQYSELPIVECFAGQLNQVFMSLIGNAIEAIETRLQQDAALDKPAIEPAITIQTQVLDTDLIQIAIQDNGCGIDPTLRSKLFDPFFTTKPVGKGTGLGLSISYQIVQQHGGKLWCQSELNQGTTFYITIPRSPKTAAAVAKPA